MITQTVYVTPQYEWTPTRMVNILVVTTVVILLLQVSEAEVPFAIYNYGNSGGECNSDANLHARIQRLESLVMSQMHEIEKLKGGDPDAFVIKDCSDIQAQGNDTTGIYTIRPHNSPPFKVYCDFDTGDPWLVIQRRVDASVDFQRNWKEYKNGFGQISGNYWLGNEKVYRILQQKQYTLRIEMYDWDNTRIYAEYDFFEIENEEKHYQLHYGNYSGTAGDALSDYHQNGYFSTFDKDNDVSAIHNCAQLHGCGWWYIDCDHANLNGRFKFSPIITEQPDSGIEWNAYKQMYSLKGAKMLIKPTFPN